MKINLLYSLRVGIKKLTQDVERAAKVFVCGQSGP